MKVNPKKQSPGCLAVAASAGIVDPKTHCKWVWEFIDAITNLVDIVLSNHNMRTAWIVEFFDNDAVIQGQDQWCQASGNEEKKTDPKIAYFSHTCPHPPTAVAPSSADQI